MVTEEEKGSGSEVYARWDGGFVVRRMTDDDSGRVLAWISALRPVSCELLVLLDVRRLHDVDGFYVGELNGEMVASLVVAPVADDLRYFLLNVH